MKDLTLHVRTSTREQSRTSTLIAHATEDVTAMINQIRKASGSQAQSSAMISMAVGNITAIAQSNLKRMLAYSAIANQPNDESDPHDEA